jgi:hypothetical integral membrane protein (TIGR02206 family)
VLKYFRRDWPGPPYRILGRAHLVTLAFVAAAVVAVALLGPRMGPEARRAFRWTFAALMVAQELSYHLWNLLTRQWTVKTMLPLHLCSVMVWLSAAMLFGLVEGQIPYEWLYFIGIGGSLQALFTPDLGIYGYPHYRFFQTFVAHGGIMAAAVYFTFVEGYRPYWISILRLAVAVNVYMAFVALVNWRLGSTYLFIARKLDTPSLLDKLGPWPLYVFWMEVIGAVWCVLSYLPFALR